MKRGGGALLARCGRGAGRTGAHSVVLPRPMRRLFGLKFLWAERDAQTVVQLVVGGPILREIALDLG